MTRVLLVEDNAASQKLAHGVLVRAGYEVVVANDADEALREALTELFDLVLMDLQLPGTDGLSATRLLRANPKTAAIPIVAVTAHAMRGDTERVLAAGCDAYVAKPIAYKELLATVARCLREREG